MEWRAIQIVIRTGFMRAEAWQFPCALIRRVQYSCIPLERSFIPRTEDELKEGGATADLQERAAPLN